MQVIKGSFYRITGTYDVMNDPITICQVTDSI